MEFIIVVILLFILEMLYIYLAKRFNIIDKPNYRSAHSYKTIRGGGIIFPFAFLLFLIANKILGYHSELNYFVFGIGFFIISGISFLDDIKEISVKMRLLFHFLASAFLLYFIDVINFIPLWTIPFLLVLVVGIINAYNFMDGINGITGLYSIIVLFSLLYVNDEIVNFVDKRMIIYPILASSVFLFFNFRKKAKSFMGDVGSMGIAFWIIALLGLLIVKTNDYRWILFLTVYGVEVLLTILERLRQKENILVAHRKHLYDLFANEMKFDHRGISLCYSFIQLIINIFVIKYFISGWKLFLVILVPSVLLYLIIKLTLKRKLINKQIL